MFVGAKRRFKDGKEHRYWSVVENCRNRDGRVVQRQVLYLGEINDSQRAAWCRSIEVLQGDCGPASMALFPDDREAPELHCETVRIHVKELSVHRPRQWGGCWLALTLWDRLELDRFWAPRLSPSRQGTRWLDVLKTQVCYQLLEPGSEWRLHRHWYEHSALGDLLNSPVRVIAGDTLYRCLDKVLEHKRAFFSFLRERWETLFQARFDVLLYDLTSTYFESDPPFSGKRQFGYSRDKRSDCVQVVIALVVTPEGFPLAYEVMPGNTSDNTTLAQFLAKIESQHGRSERVWIMDRGIPTEETLAAMRGGGSAGALPGRHPQGALDVAGAIVCGPALARGSRVGRGEAVGPGRGTVHPGPKPGAHLQGARHAPAPAEEAVAAPARATGAIVEPRRAVAQAGRGQEGSRTHLPFGRHPPAPGRQGRHRGHLHLRAAPRPAAPRRREGRYLLRSNLTGEDPATLWRYYMQLTEIEQAFKELKHDLAIRPIFHQREDRIEAHIFLAFIAYCLHVTLKHMARPCAPGLTPRAILEKFSTLQMVDVHLPTADGRHLTLPRHTQPTRDHQLLLHQLKLRLPEQPLPRISA